MNIIKKLFLTTLLITSMTQVAQAGLDKGVYASMDTNKGNILIKLFYKQTPNTVSNFVGLAEGTKYSSAKSGNYYDGLKFHRVINNFMIQGGDPKGNGTGGPGYKFADEITNLKHDSPGILSMANSGPNTNGSQFFITHRATSWLDGKHTVFGKVIKGMGVVNAIKQNDNIDTLRIIRVGTDAIKFNQTR
jgi:peptidylprolyl isomerase